MQCTCYEDEFNGNEWMPCPIHGKNKLSTMKKKNKKPKPKPVYIGGVKVNFKDKKDAKQFFNLLTTGGW